MKDVIELFKTLSDLTRLRILNILNKEELSVQEIVDIIGAAQSGISRHLSVLKNTGFIKDRKEGTWSYYSIDKNGEIFKNQLLNELEIRFKKEKVFKNDINALSDVIEKRKELSRNFFNESAHLYDELSKKYEDEKERFLSMLNLIPEGLNVIDLGCGTGKFIPFFISICANIAAVDVSEAMLEKAREKAGSYKNISFYPSDINDVPIKQGWADACFMNMVLHHYSKPSELFNKINALIKSGGKLIITDFFKHSDEKMRNNYGDLWLGFNQAAMEGWLKKSYFSVDKITKIKKSDKELFILAASKIN